MDPTIYVLLFISLVILSGVWIIWVKVGKTPQERKSK